MLILLYGGLFQNKILFFDGQVRACHCAGMRPAAPTSSKDNGSNWRLDHPCMDMRALLSSTVFPCLLIRSLLLIRKKKKRSDPFYWEASEFISNSNLTAAKPVLVCCDAHHARHASLRLHVGVKWREKMHMFLSCRLASSPSKLVLGR
jgi:hypothetical protein